MAGGARAVTAGDALTARPVDGELLLTDGSFHPHVFGFHGVPQKSLCGDVKGEKTVYLVQGLVRGVQVRVSCPVAMASGDEGSPTSLDCLHSLDSCASSCNHHRVRTVALKKLVCHRGPEQQLLRQLKPLLVAALRQPEYQAGMD